MEIPDKKAARAEARLRRKALSPADLRNIGEGMAKRIFATAQWQQAGTVFCFAAMPDEPDTTPILSRALREGKRLLLPRVLPGADGAMELVEVTALTSLRRGSYGILEPMGHEIVPVNALPADTLALIPCAAATPSGVRLGRGGGYYDRFLAEYAKTGGRRLLLCPRKLLFHALPADEWDVPFSPDEVLSEP